MRKLKRIFHLHDRSNRRSDLLKLKSIEIKASFDTVRHVRNYSKKEHTTKADYSDKFHHMVFELSENTYRKKINIRFDSKENVYPLLCDAGYFEYTKNLHVAPS